MAPAISLKLGPYTALGQFSTAGLTTSLALMPLAIATNFFGIWLVRRVPAELFYKIVYVMMFFIALELIRQGGMALLR